MEGGQSEADRKRTLYVGGLDEKVDEEVLKSAFIPFGDIKDVQIPKDFATEKARGFGFVQFEDIEDAEAAMDNMHNAELFGRVLTVNIAKPMRIKLGYHRPVWAEADDWFKSQKADGLGAVADAEDAAKELLKSVSAESAIANKRDSRTPLENKTAWEK